MTSPLDQLDWPVTTARLTIRRATEHDIDAIGAIRAEPGVSEWLTVDATDRQRFAQHMARPGRLGGTLVVEADGEVVGDAMISVQDAWSQAEVAERAGGQRVELGWVLHPARHGRGLATELVRELMRIAFDELGAHRVVAECFADNEPSWRLMERVGMRRETHSRSDALHRSGRWLDGFTYALLADEWRARRGDA